MSASGGGRWGPSAVVYGGCLDGHRLVRAAIQRVKGVLMGRGLADGDVAAERNRLHGDHRGVVVEAALSELAEERRVVDGQTHLCGARHLPAERDGAGCAETRAALVATRLAVDLEGDDDRAGRGAGAGLRCGARLRGGWLRRG